MSCQCDNSYKKALQRASDCVGRENHLIFLEYDHFVRCALASNPNLGPDLIKRLARDDHSAVLASLYANQNILIHPKVVRSIKRRAFADPKKYWELLSVVATVSILSFRLAVALNQTGIFAVRLALLNNETCPKILVRFILEEEMVSRKRDPRDSESDDEVLSGPVEKLARKILSRPNE